MGVACVPWVWRFSWARGRRARYLWPFLLSLLLCFHVSQVPLLASVSYFGDSPQMSGGPRLSLCILERRTRGTPGRFVCRVACWGLSVGHWEVTCPFPGNSHVWDPLVSLLGQSCQ